MEARAPIVHELKCWPVFFDATYRGEKSFELRKNDRDYRAGDMIILRRYNPAFQEYTGLQMKMIITCVLDGSAVGGLQEGYAILGIQEV
jgi:hypothetical protein